MKESRYPVIYQWYPEDKAINDQYAFNSKQPPQLRTPFVLYIPYTIDKYWFVHIDADVVPLYMRRFGVSIPMPPWIDSLLDNGTLVDVSWLSNTYVCFKVPSLSDDIPDNPCTIVLMVADQRLAPVPNIYAVVSIKPSGTMTWLFETNDEDKVKSFLLALTVKQTGARMLTIDVSITYDFSLAVDSDLDEESLMADILEAVEAPENLSVKSIDVVSITEDGTPVFNNLLSDRLLLKKGE